METNVLFTGPILHYTKLIVPKAVSVSPVPCYPAPISTPITRRSVKSLRYTYYFLFFISVTAMLYCGFRLLTFSVSALQTIESRSSTAYSGDFPSEEPITPELVQSYSVAGLKPQTISIPALSIEARVLHTGLTKEGKIDAPANIHDASWYTGSSTTTSSNGVALFLGHNSGKTSDGIFKQLGNLRNDDVITVTNGNGTKTHYAVVKIESKPANDISMDVLLLGDGSYDAAVITCAGSFNKKTQQYQDRTIAYIKKI